MRAGSHNRLCLSLHYHTGSLGRTGSYGYDLSMMIDGAWKAVAGSLQRMKAAHVFSSFGN